MRATDIGPEDWAGWLLLVLSFLVVTAFKEVRTDGKIAVTLWLLLAVHHAASLTNVYLAPLGFEPDAVVFHYQAVEVARYGEGGGLGAKFFVAMLGVAYRWAGESMFFAQELTVFAFALACVVFLKILRLLRLDRHSVVLLIAFGLTPVMVVIGSMVLREAYQILFFLLAVYSALRFQRGGRLAWGAVTLGSVVALASLHKGLAAFSVILLPTLLLPKLFPNKEKRGSLLHRRGVVVIAVTVLAAMVFAGSLFRMSTLGVLLRGQAIEYVVEYRAGLAGKGRTHYEATIDFTSPAHFALSVLQVYAFYLVRPFPWEGGGVLDTYASLEAGARVLLLASALVTWRRAKLPERRWLAMLIFLYLAMSLLWALGTTNYGTAIRHHLVTNWLLLIAGAPPLLDAARKQLARLTPAHPARLA